jgi:hypothetical protein
MQPLVKTSANLVTGKHFNEVVDQINSLIPIQGDGISVSWTTGGVRISAKPQGRNDFELPIGFLPLEIIKKSSDYYIHLLEGHVELPKDAAYVQLTSETITLPDGETKAFEVKLEDSEDFNFIYAELTIDSTDLPSSTFELKATTTEDDCQNQKPSYRKKLCKIKRTENTATGRSLFEVVEICHLGTWLFSGVLNKVKWCGDNGALYEMLVLGTFPETSS